MKKYIFASIFCSLAFPAIVSAATFYLVNDRTQQMYVQVFAGRDMHNKKQIFNGNLYGKSTSTRINSGFSPNIYINFTDSQDVACCAKIPLPTKTDQMKVEKIIKFTGNSFMQGNTFLQNLTNGWVITRYGYAENQKDW